MKAVLKRNSFLLLIFFFAGGSLIYSQSSKSYYLENEFGVFIPVKGKWSFDVGVGSRGMLQERFDGERISGYQHEHLELNYFTNYQKSETLVFNLGLRYRFRDLFDPAETDEFRIIEQAEFEPAGSPLSHRLRLEQRFRENTIHRLRYDIAYSTSINREFALSLGTEALYAIAVNLKPEAEQRFSIGLENSSFQDLELELGFEYRMENYLRDLAHEFFLITGVTLNLN